MMIVPVTVLVLLSVASRVAGRSWLAPGAFFTAFWAGIVVSGAIGAPDFETPWIGPAWIALACFAFSTGCAVGDRNPDDEAQDKAEVRPRPDPVYKGLPIIIVTCIVMGMTYLISRVLIIGPVWSFDEDDLDLPKAFQMLLAAHYAGPAFGGLYFASGHKRARWIGLLSLVAPALTAVVYLRRSWLLMSGMFFVGGLFTALVRAQGGPARLITPKRLAFGGAVVGGLAGVAILFQMFRLQLDGTEASLSDTASTYSAAIGSDKFEEAWTRVRVILFGYVAPFSHWMNRIWDRPPQLTWGVWTFGGPYRIVGLGERTRIEDFEIQSGALSNLYTAFYGLVCDFSPLGALAVMFVFGTIAGWAYCGVSRGEALAMPVLIGFYATTIFSPLWSLFRYNALIGGVLYLGLFFARGALVRQRAGFPSSPQLAEVK